MRKQRGVVGTSEGQALNDLPTQGVRGTVHVYFMQTPERTFPDSIPVPKAT